jgi:hypothetical protein
MARLFSLNFQFREKSYTALIAITTPNNGQPEYTVSLFDEAVRQLLPEGKLCFHQVADLHSEAERQPPMLTELMESLSSALHHKLEEVQTP